jgi:predicted DNA-binding transcriptional regulator YafY
MAKKYGQKHKLITLLKILENETDENHKLNAQALIEKLASFDISAERKSIYSDVDTLRELGYEIILDSNKTDGGYYLAERSLEKYELTLLVDAVSSSRFITEKKTRELIKKLEGLLSKYDAKDLEREVYVANRIKSGNESVYITVDIIHKAVSLRKKISFKYCEYNLNKDLVPRRDGKIYSVSPIALIWDDEYYYLVGLDEDVDKIRHYRVDKMKGVDISSDDISEDAKRDFDPAMYSNKTFGMFGGTEETVTLMFPENMVGVAVDRFGKDISIRKVHDGSFFTFRANVMVSNQFFGWITGLGSEVQIMAPESVRSAYKKFIERTLSNY